MIVNDSYIKLPYNISNTADKSLIKPGCVVYFDEEGNVTTYKNDISCVNVNKLVGIVVEDVTDNICNIAVSGIAPLNIDFNVNQGDIIGVNDIAELVIKTVMDRYTIGQVIINKDEACYVQIKNM